MDSPENKEKSVLEAATIYLLMKKGFPISRHVRAQWILDHLDTLISVQSSLLDHEEAAELEIVSVIPKNPPISWTEDTSHRYRYRVSSTSSVIFLAHKYRMVFCLDLSPSLGTIDIEHGEIVMDEVCMATKQCLKSVSRPFPIAGSKYVLEPEVYVTIIAHTPFFTNPAQQVLVQGWLIKPENLNYIMQFIEKRLNSLEEKIAQVTGILYQNQENYCNESGGLVSGLFEEKGSRMNMSMSNANVSVISPDASFINMLRYGLLALSFLPEYSSSHLVIITDGIVGATDIHVLDSVVQQFRASTVACSFIHLGSGYHPHCANGLVPYPDLLCFLATATLGSYMTFTPHAIESEILVYQQNLLCWTRYRVEMRHSERKRSNWSTENSLFYGQQQPQLLRKKLIDDKVTCTLSSLLCCRLRDGYLIKKVTLRDGCVEICFVLPWKTHVFFEYVVSSAWPPKSSTTANKIQYTITVEAPYEFLHDITCLSKQPLKSQYRQSVISRFWATLTGLTESNNMLEHFSWFPEPGWTWYNVPDTIKSGMPVFSLPPYPSASAVQISDSACPQFGKIWSPVASLDTNQWARWMHSQCVTLVLTHDRPLPKSLHQANQSGRFQCVQYRQAAAVLYAMLKNWATFVLVENHTYVQFIYREVEKPPVSFSVIRVNCKALCVVLNVAFAGGTEGIVRYNVVMDLVDRVSKLTLPNRPTEQRETPCCTIIHKALERILIRYERMPSDLSTLVFPDGTQPIPHKATPMIGGNLTTTLSRYLYHNRWLWNVKKPVIHTIPGITIPRLNITAISRIISTITKMRLTEGFNFAYSAAGIINMVLEVQMQGPHNDHHPCIIQYIIFPPHTICNPATERDSESDEDTDGGTGEGEGCNEDSESFGDFQIVTEVWIEPQCGHINSAFCPTASYMNSLSYHQLPNAIAQIDEECINALLTLEHLSLLSHIEPRDLTSNHVTNNGYLHAGLQYGQNSIAPQKSSRRISIATFSQSKFLFDDVPDERIYSMLFNFDIFNILPKCQQVELVYSMFADSGDEGESTNNILMEDLMDHMKRLHSKEILLSAAESIKFTEMLLKRPREDGRVFPFSVGLSDKQCSNIRWRCFIKGVNVSHIIVTMLPASERDVRALANCKSRKVLRERSSERLDSLPSFYISDEKISANSLRVEEPLRMVDFESGLSSRTTTAESTPKNERRRRVPSGGGPKSGLTLPIYVYDCSSTGLVEAIVGKFKSSRSRDIYQNNLFATSQQSHEEFISVKAASGKSTSPEPKSEDSDNLSNDQRKLLDHCKLIGLAQCHCYVVAVYKALLRQLQPLYEDLEAAVDQCEESVLEINITDYLRNVCKHLTGSKTTTTNDDSDYSVHACTDFLAVHNLIKEKFRKLINVAFKSVHAQSDFYFYSPHHSFERINSLEFHHSDSDDDFEAFTFHSETHDCKLDSVIGKATLPSNATWPNINHRDDPKVSAYDSTESLVSNLIDDEGYVKDQPLFLQLNCSIHCGKKFTSVPVKLLPTCFGDMHQWIDAYEESDIQSNFKVTLDIICLKLPKDVLEVNLEHSGGIINADVTGSPETDTGLSKSKLKNLPPHQDHAINTLAAEIQWLLKDEIITALLDTEPPTAEVLNLVAQHVTDSNGRPSCHFDKVPLHFVFASSKSTPKFVEELVKMKVDRYTTCRLHDFLYFVKDRRESAPIECDTGASTSNDSRMEGRTPPVVPELDDSDGRHDANSGMSRQGSSEVPENQSEVSSIGERRAGTDDGYEGDSSNYEDDCFWLVDLDRRREILPNFWLILQMQTKYVEVYFHCRFLEFSSPEVDGYRQVQKLVVSQIAAMCRRVNQYLLLESLHDMRVCDPLLEPESHEDHLWRGESNSESGVVTRYEAAVTMLPGTFRCPVVWEETFCLHPRLKTGPGRPGMSRGIKALQLVLSRFSVNNRDNMFVYREGNSNVFYLRLDEQTSDGKSLQNKLSESDERLMVSRSNSVASLSQSRGHHTDSTKSEDTRPRVRSFGEKDSDYMSKYEDSIVLMVHGISEPGLEVRQELVQVLHNRLDDAVLEVLSVMLARNPMCKLTPADVHFIQKPYRPPETYVQFTVHPHYLQHVNALAYYLRQNILQFLYIPKYTDPRAHYHLQDYSQPEDSKRRVPEADIFLNNQSQSSGNRGIACIAMAIDKDLEPSDDAQFPDALRIRDFPEILSTSVYEGKTRSICLPNGPIEFRIWMQGRVNVETLIDKLKAAIKQATWDLVMEYYLLPVPLAVELTPDEASVEEPTKTNLEHRDLSAYELGEKGQLHLVYHKTLPCWFQFALEIGVPSVKKHTVTIRHRHPIPTAVRELQNLIRANAPDTSTRAFLFHQRQPFVINDAISPETYLPFKETDMQEAETDEDDEKKVYIPFEFRADDHKSYSNAVVVARNFSQWKASSNTIPEEDLLMPKDKKLLQRFNPLVQDLKYIPRQRLLLAKVQSNQIILYMYNWSKERSEKLIKHVTSLSLWLSSRSTLFSNIVLQKIGIFRHPTDPYELADEHGLPYCSLTDIEAVSKFATTLSNAEVKEWPRAGNRTQQTARGLSYSWDRMVGQVMRDARPSMHYPANTVDPVVKAAHDLQDLQQRERKNKENLTRLYTMWQSRSASPSIPISAINLNTFKQHARLIHYCYTPILFLPQWRLQSAATRDHSLTPPSSTSPIGTQAHDALRRSAEINTEEVTLWHQELCAAMMAEYKQYLELLGFHPMHIDTGLKSSEDGKLQKTCYLKKSMLGGILLFELGLAEPFFTAKLQAIEYNRLQTKSTTTLNNQFILSFIDACEKIKINMHLHSFMYDYHLRCISSYISGVGQWSLQQGYHLTHFLDDFTKYYSKAPNFARNLVYTDTVTVTNLTTPASTLYSYLLSHEKSCGMQVFGMTGEVPDTRNNEYVLVRLQSTPLVSYCEGHDVKHTDDFTVALIVSKQNRPPQLEKLEITLKYYLILTSKGEQYPKRELDDSKLGKFRTVYSVVKTTACSSKAESLADSNSATPTPTSEISSRDDATVEGDFVAENSPHTANSTPVDDEVNETLAPTPPPVPSSPLVPTPENVRSVDFTAPHLFQIRQESINYLGYYSSHEQVMQQLIISQARAARQHITSMTERGMLHCRTHLLWNKLLESKSTMIYTEFMELLSLAKVESLSMLDIRLSPLVNQPINWYQTLAKVLQNKYHEHHKQFSTPDGNITHHLILHQSYLQAFMMLTIDLHTSRGELFAVYRKSAQVTSTPFGVNEIHSLIEGFVNACCFHLWMGLYSQ